MAIVSERADYATRYQFDLSLPVRRVALADLDNKEWHRWLLGRLGEKWPHIGAANFRGHVRSWIDANTMLFARCGRVTVLAARWTHDPLTIVPIVIEIFMFVENKDPTGKWRKELVRLVREDQIWSAGLGASSVLTGRCSDLTAGSLMEATGAKQHTELWLEPRRN